jgi:hypothetical protein
VHIQEEGKKREKERRVYSIIRNTWMSNFNARGNWQKEREEKKRKGESTS